MNFQRGNFFELKRGIEEREEEGEWGGEMYVWFFEEEKKNERNKE